jgi:hypothetical protein
VKILITAGAIAGILAAAWTLRDGGSPPTATAGAVAPATDEGSPPASVVAVDAVQRPASSPTTASADRSQHLELPDGLFVPTLNGATNCAPIANYWGPWPWSPIVGVERSSAGLDWYAHADGSYSTTQMVWREDLGRYDAMTRVAHPGPTPAAVADR